MVDPLDIFVIIILIMLIPKLVEKYLRNYGIDRRIRIIIMLGGIVWIFAACGVDYLQSSVGIEGSDAIVYEMWAYDRIGELLRNKEYELVFRSLIKPGRGFYMTYQGILYHFTGATVVTVLAINGFMAFWGGLTLTRLIYSFFPLMPKRVSFLPILIIFIPTVFYWSSDNLKEAFMYWSICQVFAFIGPIRSKKQSTQKFLFFILGAFFGTLLRPHIITMWVIAVFSIKIFTGGFRKYLIFIIVLLPIFFGQAKKIRVEEMSFKGITETAERQYAIYLDRAWKNKSTFTYGAAGPIPIFHGFINTMFRPFLWQISNLRTLLSSFEIWCISLTLIIVWTRLTRIELKCLKQNPSIYTSILVSIPFFFYFTYTINEGLITRQRAQFYPALILLIAVPVLLRKYISYINNKKLIAHFKKNKSYLPKPLRRFYFNETIHNKTLAIGWKNIFFYIKDGRLIIRNYYKASS